MKGDLPGWLTPYLGPLPLAEVCYFKTVASTNDVCLDWEEKDAADLSLAVADHQTAGRGRANRKWVTNPGAALAFSVLLRPQAREASCLPFFSPLGAIAIREALENLYGLPAEIKWPNDVLIKRKKMAGILVENVWDGARLKAVVIGIGINITRASLPPESQLLFPATCVEDETGKPVDRWQLLADVLTRMIHWRSKLGSDEFFSEWSRNMAFTGERVSISGNQREDLVGKLSGIDERGNLIIELDSGRQEKVQVGDVRLRAV